MRLSLKRFGRSDLRGAVALVGRNIGKEDRRDAAKYLGRELNNDKRYRFLRHWVARRNGRVVAITGLYSPRVHPALIAWLGWYMVDRPLRNHGLGTWLLEWTSKKATRLGYRRLYVMSTPDAVGYYSRHGFQRSKSKKLYKWYHPTGGVILFRNLQR